MISKEFERALDAAVREAKVRRHEYLTVEHILSAVVHDDLGGGIIAGCGGKVRRIKASLNDFFAENVPRVKEDSDLYPQPTVRFQKVLQRALLHARSAAKKETDAGDILASLFLEADHTVGRPELYFTRRGRDGRDDG